ncbi:MULTISPECIES: hypothetical protein [unclassified Corynebacterium]|uniref:hypothetical protein n=1 Tax=unclassified Corynebacterium TaxID=2624378 RepID=UPI00163D4381|nr:MULTISPECIES: hypothetical protein [unclassified Corynebacterium]
MNNEPFFYYVVLIVVIMFISGLYLPKRIYLRGIHIMHYGAKLKIHLLISMS